jgi:molybdopterin biosynthesis enzyme MoaB
MTPDNRRLAVGVGAILLVVFAVVGSNVAANHKPEPHDIPIGITGPPRVVREVGNAIRRRAPGAFEIHRYTSLSDARTAVLHRGIYGALRPEPTPLVLVATAASPAISRLLARASAVARQRVGERVVVRDLVPLPRSDSTGATAFSAVLSLIIAGIFGSTVIFMLARERPAHVRVVAMLALGIGAGLITALVTNVVVGAFPENFLGIWAVASLYVLAMGLPIIAFQVAVGLAGTAIGALMFLVIGNPASGGSSAPELLPGFWRAVSQLLPPGAATTAIRDVAYFHGHGTAHALIVLALWAVLGAALAYTVRLVRRRAARAPALPATGPGAA